MARFFTILPVVGALLHPICAFICMVCLLSHIYFLTPYAWFDACKIIIGSAIVLLIWNIMNRSPYKKVGICAAIVGLIFSGWGLVLIVGFA